MVDDPDDAGMLERRTHTELGLEPMDHRRLVSELGTQLLDRDRTGLAVDRGAMNHPHPTHPGELAENVLRWGHADG